ncbi:hypothetical protein BCJMU51_0840 [Bacillus cereus]|nr:hypothetical protein BCM0045_0869 [Bacillus cereus]BCB98785.1 hypothetical protein BCM0057_0868 [Bacillus cereus]BCC22278.1 hypothetical protein BCM0079_0871 [Bacillus cereus]BCC33888.1 hypothetical protein BCM0105_0878 [Bacillus cereus]BCC39675.1 hypothetical protein BCJMU01_0842 [Bacillus cereus]
MNILSKDMKYEEITQSVITNENSKLNYLVNFICRSSISGNICLHSVR